jgi:hypothetical protein
MNEFLSWPAGLVIALLVAAALVTGLRHRARQRDRRLGRQGWRLIHDLKAYSAWIEALRSDPALAADAEATIAAQALRNAQAIVRGHFPQLLPSLGRLLANDSRLMDHLSQLDQPGAPAALSMRRDPDYRQLHAEQDDLVEELIARCRVLMGEGGGEWHGTDMDTDFATSFSLASTPSR